VSGSRPRPTFRPSGSRRYGRPRRDHAGADFGDDVRRTKLDAEGPVTGGEVGTVLRDIYATTKTVVQRHDTIRSER
jgi:hypothetical protein